MKLNDVGGEEKAAVLSSFGPLLEVFGAYHDIVIFGRHSPKYADGVLSAGSRTNLLI